MRPRMGIMSIDAEPFKNEMATFRTWVVVIDDIIHIMCMNISEGAAAGIHKVRFLESHGKRLSGLSLRRC